LLKCGCAFLQQGGSKKRSKGAETKISERKVEELFESIEIFQELEFILFTR